MVFFQRHRDGGTTMTKLSGKVAVVTGASSGMGKAIVEKFAAEMKAQNFNVYVTGEYAQDVIPFCTCKYKHIQNLTLIGLFWIYKNNNN